MTSKDLKYCINILCILYIKDYSKDYKILKEVHYIA